MHPPCPSSGSELVVLPSLSPDSSDTSEELPHGKSSLASKYSAAESATDGGLWEELLTAEGWRQRKRKEGGTQKITHQKPKGNTCQRIQMTGAVCILPQLICLTGGCCWCPRLPAASASPGTDFHARTSRKRALGRDKRKVSGEIWMYILHFCVFSLSIYLHVCISFFWPLSEMAQMSCWIFLPSGDCVTLGGDSWQ